MYKCIFHNLTQIRLLYSDHPWLTSPEHFHFHKNLTVILYWGLTAAQPASVIVVVLPLSITSLYQMWLLIMKHLRLIALSTLEINRFMCVGGGGLKFACSYLLNWRKSPHKCMPCGILIDNEISHWNVGGGTREGVGTAEVCVCWIM